MFLSWIRDASTRAIHVPGSQSAIHPGSPISNPQFVISNPAIAGSLLVVTASARISHQPITTRDASALATLYSQLYDLRRGKVGDHERPHKPALLLALIDLVDSGHFADNRFATNSMFDTKDFKAVPAKYRALIPEYIKDCVSLNQFVA